MGVLFKALESFFLTEFSDFAMICPDAEILPINLYAYGVNMKVFKIRIAELDFMRLKRKTERIHAWCKTDIDVIKDLFNVIGFDMRECISVEQDKTEQIIKD